MPVGTKASFIPQDVIDSLAQEQSWPRLHQDWPQDLWPVRNFSQEAENSVEDHSKVTEPFEDMLEPFEDMLDDALPSECEAIFSIKEVLDDIFKNKGAAFGFEVFNVVACERGGGIEHRSALLRDAGGVYQLWDGPQTRQRSSVLGRIGSVTIICERIEQELLRKLGARRHVSTGELARFVSADNVSAILATTKLLDRANCGCFVNEVNVARICSKLRLQAEDIAFVHSAIFAGSSAERGSAYIQTRAAFPPQRWADNWIGSELKLYEFIANGAFEVDVKVSSEPTANRLGDEIKFIIGSCYQYTPKQAWRRFAEVSENLATAGLAAWVSHIPGSGDGGRDTPARLIITIAKAGAPAQAGARHNFINI